MIRCASIVESELSVGSGSCPASVRGALHGASGRRARPGRQMSPVSGRSWRRGGLPAECRRPPLAIGLFACIVWLAIAGRAVAGDVFIPLPGDTGHRTGSGSGSGGRVLIPLPGQPGDPGSDTGEPMIPLPGGPGPGSPIIPTPTPRPPPSIPPGLRPENVPPPDLPPPPDPIAVDPMVPRTTPVPADPRPAGEPAGAAAGALPVFPKDTSSPIFMVMKTWDASGYDGKTLLNHAVQVYAKESEDMFQLVGHDRLPDFQVNMREEDITFDELLDVVGQRYNFDWGVDTVKKTVYIYPRSAGGAQ